MNNKIKLYVALGSVAIIILGIVLIAYYSMRSGGGSAIRESGSSFDYIVSARDGLRMRISPDVGSERVLTIPDRSAVEVLEESGDVVSISGTSGKWLRVRWNNTTGWVFGGFVDKIEKRKVESGNAAAGRVRTFTSFDDLGSYMRSLETSVNPSHEYTSEVILIKDVRINGISRSFQGKGEYLKKFYLDSSDPKSLCNFSLYMTDKNGSRSWHHDVNVTYFSELRPFFITTAGIVEKGYGKKLNDIQFTLRILYTNIGYRRGWMCYGLVSDIVNKD